MPLSIYHPRLADLVTLLLGALMTLTFAPFGAWWLGPIILALYCALLTTVRVRGAFWRGWLFGSGMFVCGVSWVYVSMHTYGDMPMLLAALVSALFGIGLGLFCGLQGLLYRRLTHNRHSVWAAASFAGLWVLVSEAFRGWVLTGFPWLLIGTAHVESPLAGYAPVGGVYLVSLVTAFSGALLCYGLHHKAARTQRGIMAVSLIILWGLGALLPRQWAKPTGAPLNIALVQGNLAQEVKWSAEGQRQAVARYTQLTQQAAQADVIIWPETALPMWDRDALPVMQQTQRTLSPHTALISGMLTFDGQSVHNSVVGLDAANTSNSIQAYHKHHLVPFGEYIPFSALLGPILNIMSIPPSNIAAGEDSPAPIELSNVKLGIAICYEIIFPDLVRERAQAADMLVTVSNDTWFGASLGPLQHMQMAQMRALENNRYVIRATNNGLTGVIDAQGHLITRLPQFEASVLVGTAQPMTGMTPYTRTGNWPTLLLAVLMTIAGFLSCRSKRH